MGWCSMCCTWIMILFLTPLAKIANWTCNRIWCLDYLEIRIKEKIIRREKNGIVVKDDHNEFELMLRFFGNEILAIKIKIKL